MSRLRFALLGNAPYGNRGCEAIVRGTMVILRETFGDVSANVGSFGEPAQIMNQAANEVDPDITHFPLRQTSLARWSPGWIRHQILKRIARTGYINYKALQEYCSEVDVALQVGGDNYTLDYGFPYDFMAIDRWLRKKGIPVVLWGASVGPFDRKPDFKRHMIEHLRRMDLILVRETASRDYLEAEGVFENVKYMADPAFVLEAKRPPDLNIPGIDLAESIGLNLSALMGRYVTNGDMARWMAMAVAIVEHILTESDRKLVLVPHVDIEGRPYGSDFKFLTALRQHLNAKMQARCVVVNQLRAAEYKWIIGRCKIFIGARTHSTIAALSSFVPTISLAYSLKAVGINRDVYGHTELCINPKELSPNIVVDRVKFVLENWSEIRDELQVTIPRMQRAAIRAGEYLKDLVGL